jgi:predicted GIY-YIG superfamily endonuclease
MTCTSLQRPGFVYVMQCQRIYKIGSSLDPEKRIKEFGGDNIKFNRRTIYFGRNTTVIRRYAVDNMLKAERFLQNTFHAKRIREPGPRNRREWFALDKADLAQIDLLMAAYMTTL